MLATPLEFDRPLFIRTGAGGPGRTGPVRSRTRLSPSPPAFAGVKLTKAEVALNPPVEDVLHPALKEMSLHQQSFQMLFQGLHAMTEALLGMAFRREAEKRQSSQWPGWALRSFPPIIAGRSVSPHTCGDGTAHLSAGFPASRERSVIPKSRKRSAVSGP